MCHIKVSSAATFAAVVLSAFAGDTTFGCSCVSASELERFQKADAVFLAEVTTTRLRRADFFGEFEEMVEAEFEVLEYFKRPEQPIDIVHGFAFGIGNCSIGLMSGTEYIFFVSVQREENNSWNYVGLCTGSRAVNTFARDFEDELDQLRSYYSDT